MYHLTKKIQIKVRFHKLRDSPRSNWLIKIITINRNNERILRALNTLAVDRFHFKTFT
jgi:hypothetical protein